MYVSLTTVKTFNVSDSETNIFISHKIESKFINFICYANSLKELNHPEKREVFSATLATALSLTTVFFPDFKNFDPSIGVNNGPG